MCFGETFDDRKIVHCNHVGNAIKPLQAFDESLTCAFYQQTFAEGVHLFQWNIERYGSIIVNKVLG